MSENRISFDLIFIPLITDFVSFNYWEFSN
jgi:hypothetical protein